MAKALLEIPLTEGGPVIFVESTAAEDTSVVNAAAESGLVVGYSNRLGDMLVKIVYGLDRNFWRGKYISRQRPFSRERALEGTRFAPSEVVSLTTDVPAPKANIP
jgi:hypothetical protein